jgi:hypothetical protein
MKTGVSIPFLIVHSNLFASSLFWMKPSDRLVEISSPNLRRKIGVLSEGSFVDVFNQHHTTSDLIN